MFAIFLILDSNLELPCLEAEKLFFTLLLIKLKPVNLDEAFAL